MILGPTVKFYITGNFEWKKVKVAVGFANIRIWDGLEFYKLELYVEVSCTMHPSRPRQPRVFLAVCCSSNLITGSLFLPSVSATE